MTNDAQRLIEIAQRLDELSGDGESELQTLSEELGAIADRMPEPSVSTPVGKIEMPRWLYEIQRIVEQTIHEERYGGYDEYRRREMMMQRVMTPVLMSPDVTGLRDFKVL